MGSGSRCQIAEYDSSTNRLSDQKSGHSLKTNLTFALVADATRANTLSDKRHGSVEIYQLNQCVDAGIDWPAGCDMFANDDWYRVGNEKGERSMPGQCNSGQENSLIDNHPCFSKTAQHKVARMHLAVAPSCNIQCHYCNRKYDCSNESRPGVVSELLTPQEAVAKVATVKSKIPQLTVVGIAGPGDPLANPQRTFETCRLVKKSFPELMLCLSTNGLNLPKQVDKIAELGIHHVTLTLNALDWEVGTQIYPWIFWNNRRIRGREAAQILIDQQMAGIAKLVARKILVKINSVLIPGINDQHLPKVHEKITSEGVFLHNIMPLISATEHGTYYGLMGQREPLAEEMQQVQSHCGGVELMTHCRQCRADAVGMLGEDRNPEFAQVDNETGPATLPVTLSAKGRVIPIRTTLNINAGAGHEHIAQDLDSPSEFADSIITNNVSAFSCNSTFDPISHADNTESTAKFRLKGVGIPMSHSDQKPLHIAVASSDGININLHFGHTDTFTIFEYNARGVIQQIANVSTSRYCFGDDECGERENALESALNQLKGCDAVLCERIGFTPWNRLKSMGIEPINDYANWTILAAIRDYARKAANSGSVTEQAADLNKQLKTVGS
ncbi:MAG: nitrogenase cofactor biosynthesis protein NifB [Magnetococcales bacterium]|nr:nitrogenase cofactor biosynthesis protein NifB [Magnetococcales bacterium]